MAQTEVVMHERESVKAQIAPLAAATAPATHAVGLLLQCCLQRNLGCTLRDEQPVNNAVC